MVETEYLSKPSARKLLHLPRVVLANQSKAITLDIPRKGVVTDSGWRISPTEYPAKVCETTHYPFLANSCHFFNSYPNSSLLVLVGSRSINVCWWNTVMRRKKGEVSCPMSTP